MIGSLVFGQPERDDVEFGPVISARQLERIDGFVNRARNSSGADVMQGTHDEANGYFFSPTLITAPIEAEVVQKEVFGPVRASRRSRTCRLPSTGPNSSEMASARRACWTCRWRRGSPMRWRWVTWVNTHGVMATEYAAWRDEELRLWLGSLDAVTHRLSADPPHLDRR